MPAAAPTGASPDLRLPEATERERLENTDAGFDVHSRTEAFVGVGPLLNVAVDRGDRGVDEPFRGQDWHLRRVGAHRVDPARAPTGWVYSWISASSSPAESTLVTPALRLNMARRFTSTAATARPAKIRES